VTRRGMPTNREANFRARLERHQANVETSAGLAQLQEANHAKVQRRAKAARACIGRRTQSSVMARTHGRSR
jgi:hypothetical protein